MSVIKINAISVPGDRADELQARFAARAGEVEKADGFEEFRLLRPTDGKETWLVYTRWRDEAAFEAWTRSRAFAHAHDAERAERGDAEPAHRQAPVASHAELWSFDLVQEA